MKKSTRTGWILITLALVMGVWIFTSHNSQADQTTNAGFVLGDDGSRLKSYQGSGGSVTVPSGVTTIDAGVFANNTSITNVSLPSSVTTLGSRVFSGATNLRSVTLGRVTSIPASTFPIETICLGFAANDLQVAKMVKQYYEAGAADKARELGLKFAEELVKTAAFYVDYYEEADSEFHYCMQLLYEDLAETFKANGDEKLLDPYVSQLDDMVKMLMKKYSAGVEDDTDDNTVNDDETGVSE